MSQEKKARCRTYHWRSRRDWSGDFSRDDDGEKRLRRVQTFLIGSAPIIVRAMKIMGCDFPINKISHPQEARFNWGTLDVLETGEYDCESIEWGKVQKLAGQMSLDYVLKSIELGKAGLIDVVSTAPIHKEAIKLAGCKLPGHTGDLSG